MSKPERTTVIENEHSAPTRTRAVLTIIAPVPVDAVLQDRQIEEEESTPIPDGWKVCFKCHGTRIKTGLWACYDKRFGTRNCDICDGQGILPESDPDSLRHFGLTEPRLPYED